MKRLFKCDSGYFESKMDAKAHRNKVFTDIGEFKPVSLGPDHNRYGSTPPWHADHYHSGRVGDGFPKKRH